MLDDQRKSTIPVVCDQAIIQEVTAICEQARQFYQQAIPEITNNNVRRYFAALAQLHQRPYQLDTAEWPKATTTSNSATLWQWYHHHSKAITTSQAHWRTELPQQLFLQLTLFKHLSRTLVHPDNTRELANLTASLQMLADELIPLLLNEDL
ncbi:hypothetical protein QWY20_02400 [Alkalimonas sp. MEB108]|uniref:Uncharacterized protein n=1 Tax=Alkalimonas cellulosilytica TaxID=3058395 RepID=A0ABU7J1K7_9GAMM|nr:hypothetical protein [Alkalimonas sp. MEB108]MEE2000289.1 hypothetical protein [Alkalimonas sp. MEB108]